MATLSGNLRVRFIYNPAAGRGRAQRRHAAAAECLRRLGAEVEPYASTSPADLTREAADSSRAGYDRVIVCGGDGTLHLAIREFDLAAGTLALIPSGSGDDFAKVLGLPRDLGAACELAVRGTAREVDVATGNGIRYLGVAGLGFDSEVARYANENVRLLRGSAVYLYAIMRVLPKFTPHHVTIDGREEEIMFATFGNSRQYGGGIRITPDASIDDGLLDACIVARTSRLQLLKTLPQAYTGKHIRSPFVRTDRAASFAVTSHRKLDVYADGERITTTPANFAIAAQRLRIVAP